MSQQPNDEALARQMLVDAIIGRGFDSMEEAEHFTKIKLARYTGNQHNWKWEWDRAALQKLGEALGLDELIAIYWRQT